MGPGESHMSRFWPSRRYSERADRRRWWPTSLKAACRPESSRERAIGWPHANVRNSDIYRRFWRCGSSEDLHERRVARRAEDESDLLGLYASSTPRGGLAQRSQKDDRRAGDSLFGRSRRASEVHGGGCGDLFRPGAKFRGSANSRRRRRLRSDRRQRRKIKDFFVFRSQFIQKTGSGPVTTHNMAFTKSARYSDSPPAAAAAGTSAIARLCGVGNFGMRVVMAPAEYAGTAVHGGGCTVAEFCNSAAQVNT